MHPQLYPPHRLRRFIPLVGLSLLLSTFGQGCPSPSTATGPQGEAGPPGPAGLACWDANSNGSGDSAEDLNGDGAFDARDCQATSRIYGDGSAGALTIAADTLWTAAAGNLPPGNNTQFTDFTVNAGASLVVPSGVVIRCTGTFINNGTISVSTGAVGALVDVDANADPSGVHETNYRHPGQGIALCLPSAGEYATPILAPPEAGYGGCGVSEPLNTSFILYPGIGGGGGGAASSTGLALGIGGDGGGTLVVRARGALVNAGAIRADGDSGQNFGCGGGGGGVIILASQTSITNAPGASISAKGGNGGESNATRAPGGGGGGGLVHLIAPAIAVLAVDVAGGLGGNVVGQITTNPHQGGAGGGGSFGTGGDGGSGVMVVPGTPGIPLTAGSGLLLQTLANPAYLF